MRYIRQTNASGDTELLKECDNLNTRPVSEDDPAYLEWIRDGHVAEVLPYEPPVGPTLEELRAEKKRAVQTEKVRVKDGGFMLNGILWDSDTNAFTAYLGLAMTLMGAPTITKRWKANDTDWVDMDSALFAQVQVAITDHFEATFGWQEAKNIAIDAATLETINSISTTYGE